MVFFGAVLGAVVQLAGTVGLTWWGAVVGRRRGGAWRHLVWLPMAGFALAGLGAGLTVAGLIHAFEAVGGADPSIKAQLLSDGISRAMYATAVFAPLSWGAYLLALIGCAVGTAWGPGPAPGPPGGEPPPAQ
jgi:hypothetical protein